MSKKPLLSLLITTQQKESIPMANQITSVGQAVSQIYVIHKSGMVLLSRKYENSCLSSDPQLIGAFLAALLLFVGDSGDSESSYKCAWEMDGLHRLRDIGMSCSRFFISTLEDYTVGVLIPNESPLIQESRYELIEGLSEKIITTFTLFTTFGLTEGHDPDNIRDFSEDFGNSIDNIVFEQLFDYLSPDIKFETGGDVEVFERRS